MKGAGAHFHVVGLEQRAALAIPVFVQPQDQALLLFGPSDHVL